MNFAHLLHLGAAPLYGPLAFIALLSVIVFVHEFGHFFAARLCGVRIEVFSIGFGRPLLKWVDRHGTEWRIAWIPLGGYVRFFGDANAASMPDKDVVEPHPLTTQFPRPGEAGPKGLTPEEKKVCFHYKPVWQRAFVVVAGPAANFVLALGVFWVFILAYGYRGYEPVVKSVIPGSAAEAAGFRSGDEIQSVNGVRIDTFDDLGRIVSLSSGDRLEFVVRRHGETTTLVATPRREARDDGSGRKVKTGTLGVEVDQTRLVSIRPGPVPALGLAARDVYRVVETTARYFTRVVRGKETLDQVGGPVGVYRQVNEAAQQGLDSIVALAALLSISVGFMNLIPVPVLDGGHLLYYAYEAATGRPLGARVQAIGYGIGFVLLATLMLFVTWNDLRSLFSS